jgi:hypothetical protein
MDLTTSPSEKTLTKHGAFRFQAGLIILLIPACVTLLLHVVSAKGYGLSGDERVLELDARLRCYRFPPAFQKKIEGRGSHIVGERRVVKMPPLP